MNWNHPSVSFNTNFESKFKDLSWKRTTGVERNLCNLIYNSIDCGFNNTQVVNVTRWKPDQVKDWLWLLYMQGVLNKCPKHSSRWRLARGVFHTEVELLKVLPPLGCSINHRRSSTLTRGHDAFGEMVMPSYDYHVDSISMVSPTNPMEFNGRDTMVTYS